MSIQGECSSMKRGIWIIASFLICASIRAQQPASDNTNSPTLSFTQPVSTSVLTQDNRVRITESVAGKNVQVSGPLVQPFQSRRLADVPRRIAPWFNPFAKTEPPRRIERDEGISTRAWTEVVGWNPGGSAFPDATTHEPKMNLLVITRPKEK
jgi:hypothetical protein